MLDERKQREIDATLASLEMNPDSDWNDYIKQAILHVLRDHQTNEEPRQPMMMYSSKSGDALSVDGDSDFLRAVSGKDQQAVFEIVDDLMDTLKAVNSRAYNSVMRKISEI